VQRRTRFCTLGTLELRDADAGSTHLILAQPRRTALLSYLALARPRGFHRRDALIAMFWPERESRPARDLLNTNISRLRAALGAHVLLSRGGEELGVDTAHFNTDVHDFETAIAEQRPEDALAAYHGDLLHGFHIGNAPNFERWLEAERVRLRNLAAGAALRAAEIRHTAGDFDAARRFCRLAVSLNPGCEESVRRALALLAESANRAAALELFHEWARRFREDHDAEPSVETIAIVAAIRTRPTPADVAAILYSGD
jgi:DNA-binding SARP family transcriptional activator